ncbi:MAG: hypothetical protein NC548_39805, partial [Lachnospiraceae bacterium]|nr:hypothetical protein [Lachnospiraceae bacterium]
YKESEKGKHLTNVKPDFEPIQLAIHFNADGSNGYGNYKSLSLFLAECGTSPFLFEYNDGVTDKFCEVINNTMPKSEINAEGVFVETFSFDRQTYWYERVEESFALKKTVAASSFPLHFPFGFAGMVFKNKYKVSNPFFVDAPIIIKISGDIAANIRLYLADMKDNIVAEISLATNNTDGTEIVIDPTTKKITVTDTASGATRNGYGLTDKTKQSFLYLPQGEYYIGSNMTADDGGAIEMSIKRFLFD